MFSHLFLDGVYVNVVENTEQFTGYNGRSAALIWQSIYAENCFLYKELDTGYHVQSSLFQEPRYTCPEHSLFYKIISGTV
jgi:hypothetical protein